MLESISLTSFHKAQDLEEKAFSNNSFANKSALKKEAKVQFNISKAPMLESYYEKKSESFMKNVESQQTSKKSLGNKRD